MKIDPSLRGQMPDVKTPQTFRDPAMPSIAGWKVQLPGKRPLATPAVVGGVVFLGGGFGSYDFFALDADNGRVRWHYQTEDDGPTAAVVADDRIAFNTESCELEVLTIAGERVWKKWLGDPLMSMPAVEGGRVFMAYPDSRADRRHFLACFSLEDGKELWRQPIPGEIITAPVLANGHVHVVNLDGTLACFEQHSGQMLWQEKHDATSAPLVWRGQYFFSQRQAVHRSDTLQQTEHLAHKWAASGTPTMPISATVRNADYLDHDKRRQRSPGYAQSAGLDSSVGFAGHKGDAKIEQAMHNLGHAHISGIWAYQGSKPFLTHGRLYSSMGDTLNCADANSKEVFWKQKIGLNDETAEVLDGVLTPPALVNGKAFLGTTDGRALCLSAASGETLWSVQLGEPVLFQPAIAHGRMYVTTSKGSLFCLETGDPADDGWLMWGATPAHNGLPDEMA